MKSILTCFILLILGISNSFAQYSISGKVSDLEKQSLPYANIVIQEIVNLKNIKGTVSGDNGDYLLENISAGKYIIEISMLGYETQKFNEIEINSNKTINILLKEESQLLNEIIVKSKRPVIKQTAEKLIVDLEKSEMINTNLQDVMRKVPGVLVTNNGISIAGNKGVRILINGKTTEYMDVQTLLHNILFQEKLVI